MPLISDGESHINICFDLIHCRILEINSQISKEIEEVREYFPKGSLLSRTFHGQKVVLLLGQKIINEKLSGKHPIVLKGAISDHLID